jgi:hypothetical protein
MMERYRVEVLPRLAGVPLSAMMNSTGLSSSACSRLRSGKLMPHARHWASLQQLIESRSVHEQADN